MSECNGWVATLASKQKKKGKSTQLLLLEDVHLFLAGGVPLLEQLHPLFELGRAGSVRCGGLFHRNDIGELVGLGLRWCLRLLRLGSGWA
jgi:hypothetical protein